MENQDLNTISGLNRDLQSAEKFIGNILKSEELSQKQREVLGKFDKHLRSAGKLIYTRKQYFVCLKRFGKFLNKDYELVTKDDMENFFISIRDRKETTIFSWKVNIRLFYKWLFDVKEGDKLPDIIQYKIAKPSKVEIPRFLSEEEVKKMISITDCLRDKCFFSVMFESGCRIGEIVSIDIKDITFDKENPIARFTVHNQEGCKRGSRPISLVNSTPILLQYINEHPLRNQENPPLFVTAKPPIRRLCTRGAIGIVKKYSKRLGLEGVGCHTFRHSRFRNLREKGFSILDMKQMGGWQKFDMVERYCKVADTKIIEGKLLELNGIKKWHEVKKEELLKPKICLFCGIANDNTNRICMKCNQPLDQKEILEKEKVRDELEDRVFKLLPFFEKLEKLSNNPNFLSMMNGK